jgi:hypothetical protein
MHLSRTASAHQQAHARSSPAGWLTQSDPARSRALRRHALPAPPAPPTPSSPPSMTPGTKAALGPELPGPVSPSHEARAPRTPDSGRAAPGPRHDPGREPRDPSPPRPARDDDDLASPRREPATLGSARPPFPPSPSLSLSLRSRLKSDTSSRSESPACAEWPLAGWRLAGRAGSGITFAPPPPPPLAPCPRLRAALAPRGERPSRPSSLSSAKRPGPCAGPATAAATEFSAAAAMCTMPRGMLVSAEATHAAEAGRALPPGPEPSTACRLSLVPSTAPLPLAPSSAPLPPASASASASSASISAS